jgi:uroporphyrinogen decarboxylase
VIHFGANTSHLLSAMSEANSAVMGVDFRIGMDRAWELVGPDRAIQGNIDPAILLTSTDQIRHHVRKILDQVGGRPGHVFNLGHGILPNTPVEHAQALVEMVHEYSRK